MRFDVFIIDLCLHSRCHEGHALELDWSFVINQFKCNKYFYSNPSMHCLNQNIMIHISKADAVQGMCFRNEPCIIEFPTRPKTDRGGVDQLTLNGK